jgi:hypothetical protein
VLNASASAQLLVLGALSSLTPAAGSKRQDIRAGGFLRSVYTSKQRYTTRAFLEVTACQTGLLYQHVIAASAGGASACSRHCARQRIVPVKPTSLGALATAICCACKFMLSVSLFCSRFVTCYNLPCRFAAAAAPATANCPTTLAHFPPRAAVSPASPRPQRSPKPSRKPCV